MEDNQPNNLENQGSESEGGANSAGNSSKADYDIPELRDLKPNDEMTATIRQMIQALVHACHCHDASFLYAGHFVGTCPFPECRKMKRILAHTKSCKRTALWNRTLVRFWIPLKISVGFVWYML